jgi:hypothetical protein
MKVLAVIVDKVPEACSVCEASVKFINESDTEICKYSMKGYKPKNITGRLLSCPLMTHEKYLENGVNNV